MPQVTFDFSSYITDRTRDFVGREWVFAEIDEWLADPNALRYFIITGEPGIGKTAIAARLTQIRNLAAIHFCIARQTDTIDPLNFARSLSHQLTRIDGFALDILEEQGVHVDVHINVQENYGQIVGVQIEQLVVEAPSAAIAFNRAVLDPLKRLYADGFEQQLVFLVDALDEAVLQRGPESIVNLLANARGLPSQVRFLLTSRPEGAALRHFERLSIPHLVLDAGREENLQDVQSYIQGRLGVSEALQARLAEQEMPPQAFVERAAEASRGNFLYLVWLLRAIAEGAQRFDTLEALPKGLDGIYRDFLRTRKLGKDMERWRDQYRPLLGVLAAAQAPLTAEQAQQFTGLSAQAVADLLLDVGQFLDPIQAQAGAYRLYHQSVIDFLGSEERAAEFWINLAPIHKQIATYYQEYYAESWPDCDLYGLRYLPIHLVEAGQVENLRRLLFKFNWLQAKLEATASVNALVADYGFLSDDEDAKLVQGAIRLAAHVLVEDKMQLAGQLLGRLHSGEVDKVQTLLKQAGHRSGPWLRPVTASLIPPGGPLLCTLVGHSSTVNAVAVTPDGQRAVSASSDHTLKVWDLASGQELRTLTGHSGKVNAVAVTPDGQRAVSASDDRTLKLWDLASGQELRTLAGHSSGVLDVAVTPDGPRAVSASDDRTLKMWDLAGGQELHTLAGCSGKCVAVTPDGQRVVFTAGYQLCMWDLAGGQRFDTLTSRANGVLCVVVTPDGQWAISGSCEETLKVWDLASGQELRTLYSHRNYVNAVAVTPDGQRAVSASDDRTLKLWDLASGQELRTLAGHSSEVNAVAVTPDGQRVVSASSDHTLKVWDLTGGEKLPTRIGHSESVDDVVVTPDGQWAISASSDSHQYIYDHGGGGGRHTLKVWDLAGGQELHTLTQAGLLRAMAVTPDGRWLITVIQYGLNVWDLTSGQELHTLAGYSGKCVAVTPDGQRAVSASSDHTLKVWNLASGQELRTLTGHSGEVNAVAVTPDGQRAVSASDDRTLKVWDLASGQELRTLAGHSGEVRAVAVTPNGKWTISASRDNTLKMWDLASGQELHTLAGHPGDVTDVTVAPDGQRVVFTAGYQLCMWDLTGSQELHTLTGSFSLAKRLVMTSDGQRAISPSRDGTLRVWELKSGRCIANFSGDGDIVACAVAADGSVIVAGDTSGRVHFLRLENIRPGAPIVTAWRALHTPGWQSWRKDKEGAFAFGCPYCREWSEIALDDLGSELPCPRCGRTVKLNSFTINADWRLVAKAWRGGNG